MKISRKVVSCFLGITLLINSLVVSPVYGSGYTSLNASTDSVSIQPIERIYGVDRYDTAVKISQKGWATSDSAVLSAGMNENLVDALTAAPFARQKNAPILLTPGTTLDQKTENELIRLGVQTVYITSGLGVIKPAVIDRLKSLGITVVSLGGKDRYETSINIAKQLNQTDTIVIATGQSNADALSIAPIAAAYGYPILLSAKDSMPSNLTNYISSIRGNIKRTYVIGGKSVLSDTIFYSFPVPLRLSGVDRYATNLEVLKTFTDYYNYRNTYIVSGDNAHLVDALTLAPLAAKEASPVVMTKDVLSEETRNYFLTQLSPNLKVIGGEKTLPSWQINDMVRAVVYTEDGKTNGSSNSTKLYYPTSVTINGHNNVLENATIAHNLYIKGNNIQLNNVNVSGSIFIDPGETGKSILNNVKAQKISVLSGSNDQGIDLNIVECNELVVSSPTQVKININGLSIIRNSSILGDCDIFRTEGSVGPITVRAGLSCIPTVRLSGEFTQQIILYGKSTIRNIGGNAISETLIKTNSPGNKVYLDGKFNKVRLQYPADLSLLSNSTVNRIDVDQNSEIYINPNASINALVLNNSSTVYTAGGGLVNGNKIPTARTIFSSSASVSEGYPNFHSGSPSLRTVGSTTATFTVTMNKAGTAYYVVLGHGAGKPSPQQVKEGKNASGTILPSYVKGNLSLFADKEGYIDVTKLDAMTEYDVYFIAEDIFGNLQSSASLVEIKTN